MNKLSKILSMAVMAVSVSSASATCKVEEVSRRGAVVKTYSKSSCVSALYSCTKKKSRGASCKIALRGGYERVVRECTIYENGRRGVEAVFTEKATGRKGTGVQSEACDKAERKCEINKAYYNTCSKVAKRSSTPRPTPGQGRQHVQTYSYAGRTSSDALKTCQKERRLMPMCSSNKMSCSPCVGEGRKKASFDLYKVRR